MGPAQLIPGTVVLCEVDLESGRAGHLHRDVNELNRGTEGEKVGFVLLTGEPTLVLPGYCGEPCLHSQDLPQSLPLHSASLSSEDADGDVGWDFRAHAIRAAQRQVGACIRGIDACRNVKLDIC